MKAFFVYVICILAAMRGDAQWNYPPTKTVDASDTYFGKTYNDPYRWLENLKDPSVTNWFKAQAELTDGVLAKIPGREALFQELLKLDKLTPASYSDIICENGRAFYKKTLGGENVGKLYFREGWSGAEKLLFDPETYKSNVTTTVNSFVPSWNGKYVGVGLTSGGAEWSELRIIQVKDGTLLPDSIYPSWEFFGWLKDNQSFFYDAGKVTDLKSPDLQLNRKTKIHQIGTDVATDRDIFSNESNPELGIAAKEDPTARISRANPDYQIGSVETVPGEMRLYYAPVSELKHQKIKWDVLCQISDNLVHSCFLYGDY